MSHRVELSTKALLRSRGAEYPKFHDTSPPALLALKDGLPEKEASFLAKASEELSRKRALAMYGDEARGRGPDEIFEEEDAREAYDTAAESLRISAASIKASMNIHQVGRHPGDQPSSSDPGREEGWYSAEAGVGHRKKD